jgi:hypothetical protein
MQKKPRKPHKPLKPQMSSDVWAANIPELKFQDILNYGSDIVSTGVALDMLSARSGRKVSEKILLIKSRYYGQITPAGRYKNTFYYWRKEVEALPVEYRGRGEQLPELTVAEYSNVPVLSSAQIAEQGDRIVKMATARKMLNEKAGRQLNASLLTQMCKRRKIAPTGKDEHGTLYFKTEEVQRLPIQKSRDPVAA